MKLEALTDNFEKVEFFYFRKDNKVIACQKEGVIYMLEYIAETPTSFHGNGIKFNSGILVPLSKHPNYEKLFNIPNENSSLYYKKNIPLLPEALITYFTQNHKKQDIESTLVNMSNFACKFYVIENEKKENYFKSLKLRFSKSESQHREKLKQGLLNDILYWIDKFKSLNEKGEEIFSFQKRIFKEESGLDADEILKLDVEDLKQKVINPKNYKIKYSYFEIQSQCNIKTNFFTVKDEEILLNRLMSKVSCNVYTYKSCIDNKFRDSSISFKFNK